MLSQGGIDFSEIVPPTTISDVSKRVLHIVPDIIVMDYRLDVVRKEGYDSDFRAGGLAQVLRELFLEHPDNDAPIVLLSTEQNIRNLFAPDKTSHDLFDLWFLKAKLQSPEPGSRDDMLSALGGLVTAYSDIKQITDNVDSEHLVRSLLKLEQYEYATIPTEGLKPLLVNAGGEPEATHLIARQILKRLIEKPGILLDESTLRARLGISENDHNGFSALTAAAGFDEFLYDGVFSSHWKRFWRHRFNQWAGETFDYPLSGIIGAERVGLLNAKFDLEIIPAVSRWSGTSSEFFVTACRVCDGPTELRYSVAAFDPRITAFSERGRICYDCVDRQEELERKQIRIEEADEQIVRDIRSNIIKRPGE